LLATHSPHPRHTFRNVRMFEWVGGSNQRLCANVGLTPPPPLKLEKDVMYVSDFISMVRESRPSAFGTMFAHRSPVCVCVCVCMLAFCSCVLHLSAIASACGFGFGCVMHGVVCRGSTVDSFFCCLISRGSFLLRHLNWIGYSHLGHLMDIGKVHKGKE